MPGRKIGMQSNRFANGTEKMISRRKLLGSGMITTLLGALPRRAWALALNSVESVTDVRHERMEIARLNCEYRDNPIGIDVPRPRLFWQLHSSRRGDRQTAYRIMVASDQNLLKQGKADLWDSGRVLSDQTAQIEYGGAPLESRQECFWRVMAWDKDGRPSRWSDTASWTMGLLHPNEWQAKWVGDAVLADAANRPLTPIDCYRSQLARDPNVEKWITLDLGSAQRFDAVDIVPARPEGLSADFRTVMYPQRFKVETASGQDFSDARTVIDRTGGNFAAPRTPNCRFDFASAEARYVRLTITKLAKWAGSDYGVALGGFGVYAGQVCISREARISCSDSIESSEYSQSYLEKAKSAVELSADSKAVTVEFPGVPESRTVSRVPMLRREFTVGEPIRRARLYVTAQGFYELYLNETRIGDQVLAPGYTDYAKRIEYQTFDVTALVKTGSNVLGALLGYGWYAGHMNLHQLRCIDGFFPMLLGQLEIDLADGRRLTIVTDEKWKTTLSGPILWSDLLDGEGYDCRRELAGWNESSFDDSGWKAAYSEPRDGVLLVWPRCQPVRQVQTLRPISIREVKPNVFVYDFGQEISGYCRLKVTGAAGTAVKLRHAEMIAPDGMIDVGSLWGVAAEEDYILDGRSDRVLEPHFTYHGFRYVEVTGLTKTPADDALLAIWIHSDIETAGDFSCSNDLFNRMMEVARRTQSNLLFDVPAACAGRSERFAWLGDIRPCVQTAIFNMDAAGFFTKYAIDIRDEQTADGRYCDITPHDALRDTDRSVGSPGWADAGVSLPWQVYANYGDHRILVEHYASARRWVDFVFRNNPDCLWKNARGNDWGDWLSAGTPSTPKEVGSTAFFAHSADLVSKMAAKLGYGDDAARYRDLFERIKHAFVEAYVTSEGRIANDAQGNYALALHFDLLDEPLRSKSVMRLVEGIRRNEDHPTTGFWNSTELLLELSRHGGHSEAARMLNTRTMPSWGYIAENGTTFWESFDAIKRNQSLCHWTFSGVGEWLWRNVAGLNPDADDPGYRSITIRPRPAKEVSSCRARFPSVRGDIEIEWALRGREFRLDLAIPAGARAKVFFPGGDEDSVSEGDVSAKKASGVRFLSMSDSGPVFEVESGRYHFTSNYAG
ncbi:putative Rhamnosidase [Candidatus Sulfotelmatomonas gaucii]|uniref:alpha-L-rhamnosidase n=1 Tax=Candidatus Sulfuritelmatomonas gaucii TaxID=2043161 RepID=A0A2N9LKB4_9BACT|nr:putative Rhamnosidase [Candidatus Sulfotelmatomonas gaucii]